MAELEYIVTKSGCHECTSHKVDHLGYIKCGRKGFWRICSGIRRREAY